LAELIKLYTFAGETIIKVNNKHQKRTPIEKDSTSSKKKEYEEL
jgi:hypothetical protein